MPPELLYQRDEYLIIALLFGLLMLAVEAGYRGGRVIAGRLAAGLKPGELGTLQGAMIGLLALLLAFSLQMAVSRFEARRLLLVKEANTIGTAGLRSRLLPEPDHEIAAGLFRRYLARRLAILVQRCSRQPQRPPARMPPVCKLSSGNGRSSREGESQRRSVRLVPHCAE
jgi:hypothetical protein